VKVRVGKEAEYGNGSNVVLFVDGKYASMSWNDFRKAPVLNLKEMESAIIDG
jgi:hypothetical protein